MTGFAESNHLNLFVESGAAVRQYRSVGLPYDLTSLATAVSSPRAGANLKGIVVLVASGQSDFGITKVEFVIDGPQSRDPVVEGAGKSDFGWLSEWNTTTFANGRYSMQSVAYDAAGHRTKSKPVVTEVAN